MPPRRRWAALALSPLLVLAAACGDSNGEVASGSTNTSTTASTDTTTSPTSAPPDDDAAVDCPAAIRFLETEFLLSVYVQSNEETRERYETSWFEALDMLAPSLPPEVAADASELAALDSAIVDWTEENSAALDRIMVAIAPACFPDFEVVNCRTAPAEECGAWQSEVSDLDVSELPWGPDSGGSTTTR